MLIFRDSLLRKRILTTALPAMAEMILYMLIGVVDIAVVGRLGASPLAAVGLGAEIFFSVVLFLEALGVGASVLVAQAKGAAKMEYAGQVAGQTCVVGLIIGLVAAVLGLTYAENLLGIFAVEKEVFDQALPYLKITFLITPLALVYFMINSVFRGLGRTDIPMKIAIVTNIINCAGDYVLVYGVLGFPAMGVAGAALATSIAHVVGFIIATVILMGKKWGDIEVKWQSVMRLQLQTIKEIIRLGFPSLIEFFFHNMANLVSMFLLVYLGTLAFASHQVALTVESISFMPGIGIALATTALIGHAVGAGDKAELLKAYRGCLELVLLSMGFIGLLFACFPYFIAGLFTNDPEIIKISGLLIRLASLEQLSIAFNMLMSGVLKGTGDTRSPMIISTAFIWLFRLPLMYFIIRVWSLSINYVWMMFVIDWFLRSLVYLWIMHRKKWADAGKRV